MRASSSHLRSYRKSNFKGELTEGRRFRPMTRMEDMMHDYEETHRGLFGSPNAMSRAFHSQRNLRQFFSPQAVQSVHVGAMNRQKTLQDLAIDHRRQQNEKIAKLIRRQQRMIQERTDHKKKENEEKMLLAEKRREQKLLERRAYICSDILKHHSSTKRFDREVM